MTLRYLTHTDYIVFLVIEALHRERCTWLEHRYFTVERAARAFGNFRIAIAEDELAFYYEARDDFEWSPAP